MADLIKKIKIKKEDGTYTDYIPIGAEAKNVSTKDGESVETKLNKKPYYYNTVTDMKADKKLKAGDMCITLGYRTKNDGGDGLYHITNSATPNNMDIIELNNHNFACLVITSENINPAQLGAYFDTTHDDSLYIQRAIEMGNVEFSHKSHCYINNTINISRNRVSIDGNDSEFKIGAGVTAFQISTLNAEYPLANITIKNMFPVFEDNASFCLCYNSYFVNFEDIRIQDLKGTGIEVYNGFNVNFKNVHINGSNLGVDNIAKNHNIGIKITLDDTDVSEYVSGLSNATNIIIDSCLIQRCEYGIYLNATPHGIFDTNIISNIGFSSCDYAIYNPNQNRLTRNQVIDTARFEYCGTAMTLYGEFDIRNIYLLHTKNGINSLSNSSNIGISGNCYHWNNSDLNGHFIENNNGRIDLSKLSFFNLVYSGSVKTNTGTIIPWNMNRKQNLPNTNIILNNYLECVTYNVNNSYLDLSNIDFSNYNGLEFYLYSSISSKINVGNNEYILLEPNKTLHFRVIDNVLKFDGNSIFYYDSTTQQQNVLSQITDKFATINVTSSLLYFNFTHSGVTALYSTTQGVTLSNNGGFIKNFDKINNNNPIDLFGHVLLLIPTDITNNEGYGIYM